MFQPGTLALMLVLAGAVAGAQPSAGPVLRKRSLTVTGNPSEPVPEVRGAKGLGITFHFDGPILEESVRVDAARVRVVDVGKRSLLVEPLVALQAEAPTEVSVVYEQGEPRRATFVLVAHPSEVDVWVEVTRRMRQPEEACQARLDEVRASCGAHSPTAFRRSGLLTAAGIQAQEFRGSERNAGHLVPEQGVFFLGKTWALVELELRNETGQPWVPRVAAMKGKSGQPVTVRQVTAESEELAPGESGRVWVETDVPPADAGIEFTLEVTGADGRSVQAPKVQMPPRTPEGKR